jgi:ribosome-binding protein aMBF1 (putative translation factor)
MAKKERISSAVAILHGRYVKNDPERIASLQEERVNAEVASLIHQRRNEAGISQAELAELIGTTQSVISRLEDADYDGHSLTMLTRIASALNQRLTVAMTVREPNVRRLNATGRRKA